MTSPPMRVALVLCPLLLASCGGRAGLDVGSGATGSLPDGGGDAGHPIYAGVVVLSNVEAGTLGNSGGFADFQKGPPPGVGTCPGAESCCCLQGHALPSPGPYPDAGTVTVSGPGGGAVVMLMPTPMDFQGTWDLGDAWATLPGDYPFETAGFWDPGEAMHVSATGGAVHAFSGTLQTGALLSGVTPSLPSLSGPVSLVIDRTQPFHIAWDPEGLSDESVVLWLQQFRSDGSLTCWCSVPDTAAELTVDTSVLGQFDVQQLSAVIQLERLITRTVSSDDAIVALVGEVAKNDEIAFQ